MLGRVEDLGYRAVVTGRLKWYDVNLGYGFVTVGEPGDSEDVYISEARAREVVGSAEHPKLTRQPLDPGQCPLREGETPITMQVAENGQGGWRADFWGPAPPE